MAGNALQKLLNEYVNNKITKAKNDYKKIVYDINNELYNETSKMYDKFIDDFYSYPTTSYIRHGSSSPGAGGINLYRANNIRIGGSYHNPKLIIDINADDMEGGYKYKVDDKDLVLDYVMEGYRFPYGRNAMTWTSYYSGKYFSYSCTPSLAFDLFEADFDSIVRKMFRPRWKATGWCD